MPRNRALTMEQVKQARESAEDASIVALRFGVSPSLIRQIRRYERYICEKPAKKKKRAKVAAGYARCPGCGCDYKIGAPHVMFCSANTCENCGASYAQGVPENEYGKRICEDCKSSE